MKLNVGIVAVFFISSVVLYNLTILWQHQPVDYSLYTEESNAVHRPHVKKYAIIVEPDDGRLDELGGPDHWYSLSPVWYMFSS